MIGDNEEAFVKRLFGNLVLAALAVVVVRAVRKKKPLGRLGKKKSKLPAGEEPKSEE